MTTRTVVHTVATVARVQHGLITRRQLLEAGLGADGIHRWLQASRIETVFPAVFRMAGAQETWESAVTAATLRLGHAAASHRSAARLWGLLGGTTAIVEVSMSPGRSARLPGVVVHRQGDFDERVTVRRNGIWVTNPLRTLLDLGAVLPPWLVEEALDRALVQRLVTIAALEAERARVGRRGRDGSGVLRMILEQRALGSDRPDSLLEPCMARVLRAAGLPPATFQHIVRDGCGRFVAKVDFAYPELCIAIEVDGFETHGTPQAMQNDLRRQNVLVNLGWTVLRFTWNDVVRRPAHVADVVRTALIAPGLSMRM